MPFFFNQCLDKKRLKKLILWSLSFQGEYRTLQMIEDFKTLGFQYATSAGVSLSIDDLTIPPKKRTEVLASQALIMQSVQGRAQGNRTAIEEIQTVVDMWHRTSETVKDHVIDFFEATNILNPVYMMAFSGARGNVSQVRQLVGMRGLMADPKGDIIGYAIRSNFREGLTITEYMISAYGARKGVVDTALRTADAGYLTRRLVDVAQHVIVQQGSCGTSRGILLQSIKEGSRVVLSVHDRLLGRVLARDLYIDGQKMASRNDAIDHDLAFAIANAMSAQRGSAEEQAKIIVRSPLTCAVRYGVCQLCYGWSFTQNRMVTIGDAVGVMAGQSIGEPGTQLTMRTFHTGGVFTGEVQGQFRSPQSGIVHYPDPFPGVLIRTPYGQIAFLVKKAGTLIIRDEVTNKETVVDVPTRTALFLREGERIEKDELLGLPSDVDGQGNDKMETRKIVFSDFAGEVFFQQVARKDILFPEKPAVRRRRVEVVERDKRRLLRGKPDRHRFMAEVRAERYRQKKHYTRTANLGTLWILAGEKMGPLYKTMPLFHSGGHLVEAATPVARFGIVSPAEGFLRREPRPTRAFNPLRLLPPTPQYQLEQEIDEQVPTTTIEPSDAFSGAEAWIYQPQIYADYNKIRFDAFQNHLSLRTPTGEIFLIPDYTRQVADRERRHRLEYSTYGTPEHLKTMLYPWREEFGWESVQQRRHSRNLEVFYFQEDCKIKEQGVFVWKEALTCEAENRHGLLFLTPYLRQERTLRNLAMDQEGWRAPRPRYLRKEIAPLPPMLVIESTWLGEGDVIDQPPNLQGQIRTLRAQKSGIRTVGRSTRSETTVEFRPEIKRAGDETRQLNPREQHRELLQRGIDTAFPFSANAQDVLTTVVEHMPGWAYLPAHSGLHAPAAELPEFEGQHVTHTPVIMTMACSARPVSYRHTTKSLYTRVGGSVEGQEEHASPIPSLRDLRLLATLRHPRLIPDMKAEAKDVRDLTARLMIVSHPRNRWYQVFGTDESRFEGSTGRFLHDRWNFVFEPSLGNTAKSVHTAPLGACGPRRPHVLSFGLVYQSIREFSLDRLPVTMRSFDARHTFELSARMTAQQLPTPLPVTGLQPETSLYAAFQSPEEAVITQRPTIQVLKSESVYFWSKQVKSRLVPNDRPRQTTIVPCILPENSYLDRPGFVCRFLLQFAPLRERREKTGHWCLRWTPPWDLEDRPYTSSTLVLSFVKRPALCTKADEIFHPEGTWLMYGDPFIRRYKYTRVRGETQGTASHNCLVLKETDMETFALSRPMQPTVASIGDILRFGDEIEPGVGLPIPGQIVAITPTTITVRKAQPVLFYGSGAIHVQHAECIPMGQPLVTLSYQRLITGDIVQGIPKVEQLFEGQARDKETGIKLAHLLARRFLMLRTRKEKRMSARQAFNDCVRIFQHKIIESIQKVYLSQGVSIADIHFEIIVRRITSWGKIRQVGKSGFFRHEIVPLDRIEKVNAGIPKGRAVYEPIIVGISAAALNTESFLSAASFQETSRVLTRDTMDGKTDFLRGVKERVIIGDLIPAGTGFTEHAYYVPELPKPLT